MMRNEKSWLTISVLASLWVGCATNECKNALRALEQSGNLIYRARYVDARVVYSITDPQSSRMEALRIRYRFGPNDRLRIDSPVASARCDGHKIVIDNAKRRNYAKSESAFSPGNISFLVAAVTGIGQCLPLPVARASGGNWFRELYGVNVSVRTMCEDEIGGVACERIELVPDSTIAGIGARRCTITWWIRKDSKAFRRFRIDASSVSERGILVEGDYQSIDFPGRIDDKAFGQ